LIRNTHTFGYKIVCRNGPTPKSPSKKAMEESGSTSPQRVDPNYIPVGSITTNSVQVSPQGETPTFNSDFR